ncbi:helix-turn-helix transcriptional regulator [Halostella salina]|uniref:helix-turn-helix transcriptional regulator n=1 Tax=Halostella salina TaxID=1547897 RepID=UPI000EF78BFC|nr:hypothetical protein [Halostella salina]
MDARTTAATALCLALVLSAAGVASPALAAGTDGDPDPRDAGGQSVDTDEIRILVTVAENGTARWELQYWTRLDDENTTQAFEELRRDIEANPGNYTADFRDRIGNTVGAAENDTGREMAVRNVRVSADRRSIPDEYGVVTYSFTWEAFAVVDGDGIRVGDAIRGFFLSSETRLTVEWPEGYDADVSPPGDDGGDGSVTWRGTDTDFASGEPSIVLTPADGEGGGNGTDDGDTSTGGDDGAGADGGGDGGSGLLLGALALVGLAAAGGVAYWFREGADATGDETTGGGEATDSPSAGGGAAAATTAQGDDADGDDGPPPELLSNEERVLRLLDQRGGRMKQQEVVEALDWTEAKTSQVVGDLRDEGQLESFRLGRENVLSLPGEGPDEAEP